jgi:hypothetical protein
MATMNFSIPDDVKERFNQAFVDANKSAIVTQLLEEAIERAEQKRRSDLAVKTILSIRKSNASISTKKILRTLDGVRKSSSAVRAGK